MASPPLQARSFLRFLWRSLTASEPGYSAPVIYDFDDHRQLFIWHGDSLNLFTSMLVPLIAGLQLAFVAHLCSAWQRERRAGRVGLDALGTAARVVLGPSSVAALTSACMWKQTASVCWLIMMGSISINDSRNPGPTDTTSPHGPQTSPTSA